MNDKQQKVAIITGGSQGIGAGLVAGYRRQGWAVVANSRTIKPSEDRDVLTVDGDISEAATVDRIISGALERFGRIDTLANIAGVFISNRSPTTPLKTTHSSSASTSRGSSD